MMDRRWPSIFGRPHMLRSSLALTAAALVAAPLAAEVPLPAGFQTREIQTNGTTIHVRFGGKGPAVVLLHGFGDTGDMWAPLVSALVGSHTVIVPDLRGMGLSAVAEHGFEKSNQAKDVAEVLSALKIEKADIVGHDIGNMVAF